MRTVCPSCQAAYDVPASILAAGRTLRCARCATDFTPRAEQAALPAPIRPPPAATQPAAAPTMAQTLPFVTPLPNGRRPGDAVYQAPLPPASRPWSRMGSPVIAGWAASFLLLAVMGWSFVAWRAPIMRAWPESTRLYAVLGLV